MKTNKTRSGLSHVRDFVRCEIDLVNQLVLERENKHVQKEDKAGDAHEQIMTAV